MRVPFLDLRSEHDPLRAEIFSSLQKVVDESAFAGGPFVARFEEDFAAFCGTEHAVGLGNGTDALWMALLALGVGPGDEVITVPNSFIATVEAISLCGATPVFVDVDEATYTLDPSLLEAAVTPRTKAVIPVHLYGQMADMDPIMAIARDRGLWVVEDACQAHGAEYKGRRAGSIGHAGCFSFYPGKNLGAWGEAGAVVTGDRILADKLKVLREHGQSSKYHHACIGWNARMDGMQAAVLRIKLRGLEQGNAARRAHAAFYSVQLSGLEELNLPATAEYALHAFHLYVVRVGDRDSLLAAMTQRGVSCGIHYPVPVHLQPAYRGLGLGKGSFPISEACASDCLSLPLFPHMTPAQIQTVVQELKLALALPRNSAMARA
jgi:dTDP-4-amino-4,6-dideoxygalactose transaminase